MELEKKIYGITKILEITDKLKLTKSIGKDLSDSSTTAIMVANKPSPDIIERYNRVKLIDGSSLLNMDRSIAEINYNTDTFIYIDDHRFADGALGNGDKELSNDFVILMKSATDEKYITHRNNLNLTK